MYHGSIIDANEAKIVGKWVVVVPMLSIEAVPFLHGMPRDHRPPYRHQRTGHQLLQGNSRGLPSCHQTRARQRRNRKGIDRQYTMC